jgi:hypothetical protein
VIRGLSFLGKAAVVAARDSLSKHEREVTFEIERARVFAIEGNVVGLIQMLDSDLRGRSEYSIVRGEAASRLGQLGDPRAIPYLMKLRDDPEKTVQVEVARALGRLQAREAEGFLLESLNDPSPLLRMTAATALGQVGSVDAIPLLRNSLDSDPDPYVRLRAVESLVILGDKLARDRVPDALSAVARKTRERPRYKRLREAVENGEPLTPWVSPGTTNPRS